MNPALALLNRCRRNGIRLRPVGEHLAVFPVDKLTPALAAELRAAKPQLLDLLEAEAARLTPDCAPWLHVARQVLAGEFDGGDRSLLESLRIGVRNIAHPLCQQARARLEVLLGKRGWMEAGR